MTRIVGALLAVLVVAGCSSSASGRAPGGTPGASSGTDGARDGGRDGAHGSITVFAAASLTGPFTTLGQQFEKAHPGTKVLFNFGGSSALATQIDEGAPADVFASAAPKNMADVTRSGNAPHPVDFVSNTMEIAAAPGNPRHIASVADLARAGVQVALCEASVPCGVVAAEVFAKAGVTVRAATRQPDVKSTLAVVASGEVDAGLVYVTDVRAAGSKVVGVPIPDAQNASTAYPIAILTHARNPALAKQFVDYVLSAAGRQVLTAAGFRSP